MPRNKFLLNAFSQIAGQESEQLELHAVALAALNYRGSIQPRNPQQKTKEGEKSSTSKAEELVWCAERGEEAAAAAASSSSTAPAAAPAWPGPCEEHEHPSIHPMGLSIIQGLIKSIAMTIVSEIGDKTFFVAALMAMRHPRRLVLGGAFGALAFMTVLSAVFGWAAPNLISRRLTHNLATVLFFAFGLRSIWDALTKKDGELSELAEVEAELNDDQRKKNKNPPGKDVDDLKKQQKSVLTSFLSPILLETFSLTFLGEWGDKSQIATIGLASQESVVGVALGGIFAHFLCSSVAVAGGKHLASRISERTVAFCGGFVFLAFGVHSLLSGAHA